MLLKNSLSKQEEEILRTQRKNMCRALWTWADKRKHVQSKRGIEKVFWIEDKQKRYNYQSPGDSLAPEGQCS